MTGFRFFLNSRDGGDAVTRGRGEGEKVRRGAAVTGRNGDGQYQECHSFYGDI